MSHSFTHSFAWLLQEGIYWILLSLQAREQGQNAQTYAAESSEAPSSKQDLMQAEVRALLENACHRVRWYHA